MRRPVVASARNCRTVAGSKRRFLPILIEGKRPDDMSESKSFRLMASRAITSRLRRRGSWAEGRMTVDVAFDCVPFVFILANTHSHLRTSNIFLKKLRPAPDQERVFV